MSAEGWGIIIGAISMGLVQVVTAIFAGMAYLKSKEASTTAATVKSDLAVADNKLDVHRAKLDGDVATIKKDQKVLVQELNGIKAAQLKEHGEAEHAKGVLEGRENPLPPPTSFDAH